MHAESFVTTIESLKLAILTQDSVMQRWSDPLMVMVLTMDLLGKLRSEYNSLDLRIQILEAELATLFTSIYGTYPYPARMEILMSQRSVEGKSVLEYIASLHLFEFLQIKHVFRVVDALWAGSADAGGSILSMATSY